MAKALKHANDNDDPEFREAVKRYYPNAKYGPKIKAAAEAQSTPTVAPTATTAPVAPKKQYEDEPGWDWRTMGDKRRGLGPSVMGAKPIQNAVKRRVEPKVTYARNGEVNSRPASSGKSQRGVNQSKAILGGSFKPGSTDVRGQFMGGVKAVGRALKPPGMKMWPSSKGTNASQARRKRVEAARRKT